MVAVTINKRVIRRTLIDNGSRINICSMDMLKEINVNPSIIQPDNVLVCVFDNISKSTLGIITLPIKVGSIILNTSIHVMPRPLNYNLLLVRPLFP